MADEEKDISFKELSEIYKKRLHDRSRFNNWWRKKRVAAPDSAGLILNKLFKKDPQALSRIEESRAIQAWPRIVGEAAAGASVPLRVRGHKLIVSVPDPMWRQQLILLRSQLVRKYAIDFPKLRLRDIFFVA